MTLTLYEFSLHDTNNSFNAYFTERHSIISIEAADVRVLHIALLLFH